MPSKYEGTLFGSIVEDTIGFEGDAVDTSRGGISRNSKHGVEQQLYDVYRKRWGKSPRGIDRISKDEAKDIYYQEFYAGRGIDELNPNLQSEVFDWEINGKMGSGIKALQGIFGLEQDGIIGPNTIAASNQFGEKFSPDINTQLLDKRQEYYNTREDRLKEQYLDGWTNRVNARKSKYSEVLQ